MKALLVIVAVSAIGLFLTPDQQGQRRFKRGEFGEAAETFTDPMWQGVAWFRAGEFEKAAQAFARRNSAEALYNQGNAWLMTGKYETAIGCYDRALEIRPEWKEAADNRALARARAEQMKQPGGEEDEGEPGEITFKENPNKDDQKPEVVGAETLSDQQIQALWLRRVQTRPADFLRAKFAYQQSKAQEGGE